MATTSNSSVITATGFYGNDERLTATWLRRAVAQFDSVVRAELKTGHTVLVVGNGGSWGHAIPSAWWASQAGARARAAGRCTFELHTCDPESVDGKRLATSQRMMRQRCGNDPIVAGPASPFDTILYPNFQDRDQAIGGLLRTWNDVVCVFAMDTMADTTFRQARYFRVHERKPDLVRSRWFVPTSIASDATAEPSKAATKVAPQQEQQQQQQEVTTPTTFGRPSLEQHYWRSQEKVSF